MSTLRLLFHSAATVPAGTSWHLADLGEAREALRRKDIGVMPARSLRLCRQFFLAYPEIWQSTIAKSGQNALFREPATPKSRTSRRLGIDGRTLIARLSFTHLAELVAIDDPLKRAFYEVECIRGNWSVRARALAQVPVPEQAVHLSGQWAVDGANDCGISDVRAWVIGLDCERVAELPA